MAYCHYNLSENIPNTHINEHYTEEAPTIHTQHKDLREYCEIWNWLKGGNYNLGLHTIHFTVLL